MFTHTRICYSDRRSTVQQNDSDRTGHRLQKNNIQIYNVQNSKNTIYNTDNYVCTGLICANLKWKISAKGCKKLNIEKITFWSVQTKFLVMHILGSHKFKIPGSPSVRSSSEFGNPKIYLTSPNNFLFIFYFFNIENQISVNVNQKHFQCTNINT